MQADPAAWRREFPALDAPVHGRRLAYLDSASTSLKPRAVIDTVIGLGAAIRSLATLDRAAIAGHEARLHARLPLHHRLGIDASARASLALYNDDADVDARVASLARVRQVLK